MAALPANPHLDHLRHQAKDLLRAARQGDPRSIESMRQVSERLTLGAAQRAVARSYGFSSWAKLKAEVETRTADFAKKAAAFLQASIGDWTGRAARLLAETPELGDYNLATALVLGDVDRLRTAIELDPAAATRQDPSTGWTALHAACGSRWNHLDPDRADGLVAVARLLLAAGADPNGPIAAGGRSAGSTPLRCAAGSASVGMGHAAIIALLVEHGARIEDDDLYLAAFSRSDRPCLRVLLDRADVASIAEMALGAPISAGDTEGVRLMLDAGADPRRLVSDQDRRPLSAVYAAVEAGCPVELIDLLVAHGSDPSAPGPDGRSPAGLAALRGRDDLTPLFAGHAGSAEVTDAERFIATCMRADRAGAELQLAADPGLVRRLGDAERAALVNAADAGNAAAVTLMLDLGFPITQQRDDGATALHAAAYAGRCDVVALLLSRGAELEAADGTWESAALEWAVIGSGDQSRTSHGADWVATVRTMLDAGASTEAISLSPDDQKPPSPEVAHYLRGRGLGTESSGRR